MKKKLSIRFQPVAAPITEPVTKFGGQPVWISEPQWPISKESGEPMAFICQIVLVPELFGDTAGKLAYIFMTDDGYVDETWDPDAGENAVIIQPGNTGVETQPLMNGPAIFDEEFSVELEPGEDPDFIDESDKHKMSSEERDEYNEALSGNKIGGTPGFMQFPEFPNGGPWNLLLQLDSATVPFDINVGDAGIAYMFISTDGQKGKFLWQCG
jgi:uncharacterized protein YwqG